MDPELYLATTSGDVGFLKKVADAANIQLLLSKAPQENTALHIAARFGHPDFTKEILQLCIQLLNMKNSNDETALHCAARVGCLEIVEILVDHGLMMSPDHVEEGGSSIWLLRMQNREGDTALHEALRNREEATAIKMLRADPKLSLVLNKANESSFLIAVKEEMEEVVKEILSIDGSANRGEFHAAASSNISDTVVPVTAMSELTAEERTKLIRIQDNTGRTALQYVAWRNNAKIVRMILKSDSCHVAYIVDNNGHSPLHVAAAFGMKCSMLELLKHCPDTVEQQDTSGSNVLHIALLNRRDSIIRTLRKLPYVGELINGQDKEGNTPLHLAAREYRYALLSGNRRAKLNMRNEDGRTALALSAPFRFFPKGFPRGPVWGYSKHMPDVVPRKRPRAKESGVFRNQYFVLVASFIATITFAAAFTFPGGYKSSSERNPGTAVLARRAAFKAFVLLDTLAMCLSTVAIFCYISGWNPIWQGKRLSDLYFTLGNVLTFTACCCMLLAFSAGVFLVVAPESIALAIAVFAICSCLPCFFLPMLCRIQRARKASGVHRKPDVNCVAA